MHAQHALAPPPAPVRVLQRGAPPGAAGSLVDARNRYRNDIHSRLNPTRHARVFLPEGPEEVAELLVEARSAGKSVACAGAQHAMGGQQFLEDGWLLDTRRMAGVLDFDADRGLVQVAAGTRWPALQRFLAARRDGAGRGWSIAQKQTGADDFSLGGSLASNIHGRGLDRPPLVDDIERFTLVLPQGCALEVDRQREPELFSLAVGGYGLFGVVSDLTLRLRPRQLLQRSVRLLRRDGLAEAFESARREGARFGDFQFAIDPRSADFMDLGILACYLPTEGELQDAGAGATLSASDWQELLRLAHVDKSEAFRRYSGFYLSTHGQRYASDDHQFGVYLDGYHSAIDAGLGHRGSEVITELYVPPNEIGRFLGALACLCRESGMDVVYGTVRQIRRDAETLLSWARDDRACVVLNLHVRHDQEGMLRMHRDLRQLYDLALGFGGSFYLSYGLHASAAQLRAAYPDVDRFVAAKRRLDPGEVLSSSWFERLSRILGSRAARGDLDGQA
ncbi:FAD-binding oxidoreductase [Pseudomarimonas salicorniae]|uniref:FAD-binding oxidoreductase n=1 Tax=Pseudomarimonas salicorniae TaxID=2933270 RepID=A0ABT0GK19_9GAMM|nr:FAD-binding oxidoreductase [Lysobacter sp. CAU 1642]MCK7594886.1 FAD-binding oxidoreductase [Lysobacter sp. CAU 1642]